MLNIAFILLGGLLVYAGYLVWQQKNGLWANQPGALSLWFCAFALVTNAPLAKTIFEPELASMGMNLTVFVGLPMMALVLIDFTKQWQWQLVTWGRIFLGLAAMFELLRRAESGNNYAQFIFCACAISIAYTFLKSKHLNTEKSPTFNESRLMLGIALILMAASFLSFDTSHALAWNALALLSLSRYLYLAASKMALCSPSKLPK
jgi:hypothetical protein